MPCSSLPGLKRTTLPGGMLTSSPVRGLRPIPVFRGRTLNTPNRRSSMRWPRPMAFFSDSNTVSTACSAFTRLTTMPSSSNFFRTAFTISSLITRASGVRGQMLEGRTRVVKTYAVLYTVLLFQRKNFHLSSRRKWMSVKPDRWIRRMAIEHKMIEPFTDRQVREGVISYGVSSYGYDIRVADEFQIFTNVNSTIVDPKHFDPRSLVPFKGAECLIPPNSFALARSVEYFRIPRNVLTICLGKSTYARCGIIVNVTPFEPEWEGYVTLEFSNTTPLPAKVYANEGVAQVIFFESDDECETSYKDRGGKYQGQLGVTP